MTREQETFGNGLPSLAGADWLVRPSTRAVFEALEVAGYEARVVGGSVRNALMGLAVSDLDIATPAEPDDVMRACADAGLVTVPTGLSHGTVTVIADRTPVEVTTLRRDVQTDGRHATVVFSREWAEDARRRDFTMNALYCDAGGRVYDYVGGYADLVARRVRFIGDPDARIAEDYLRILRFFRFHATYAVGAPDPEALAACARGASGMARLSAERVRAELLKLLVAPGAVEAIRSMEEIGLLSALLGVAPRPDVMASVVAAEGDAGSSPDAMLRLSALAIAVEDDIPRLAQRLRLSGDERKALFAVDVGVLAGFGEIDARRAREIVYRNGSAPSHRLALALAGLLPQRDVEARLLRETALNWPRPRMPITGADLVGRGLEPGPGIGALLADVEAWWVAQDFPDRDRTLRHLETLLARRRPD